MHFNNRREAKRSKIMALLPFVSEEQFGKLSEPLQEHYAKGDNGNYTLNVTASNGWSLENVSELKTSLSSEREQHRAAKRLLDKFGDIKPKDAKDALKKIKEMADWDPDKEVSEKLKAREQQLISKHEAEQKTLSERNTHLTKQIEKQLVENVAIAAISKHKGNIELLLPHVQKVSTVVEDDKGNFASRIVDKDGNPRLTMKPNSTAFMDHSEFVESMKTHDTFAAAFDGSGASGTGAEGSRGKGGAGSHTLTYEQAKDPAVYRRAKEEASKAGKELIVQPKS
jgi:hypothetical protein